MGTTYVVDGAKLRCTKGTTRSILKLHATRSVELCGSKQANVGDCRPVDNVQPFGACKAIFPPKPCLPVLAAWSGGKEDVLVESLPALLSDSTLICNAGAGIITIDDDGQ